MDEAYVDVTGRRSLGETAETIAASIRSQILAKTGCVASVGSGPNRLIARLATKKAKPDGACHVSAAAAASFLAALPAEDLPGVGRSTLDKLLQVGVGGGAGARTAGELTCADVVATPLTLLQRVLGPKSGAALLDAAKGVDRRAWEARPPRRSVGAQVTWGVRFVEAAEAVAFVEKLAVEVSERMRRLKTKGKTLTLKVLRAVANAPDRYMKGSIGHGVCDHLTRSVTLSSATDAPQVLQREAVRLLADLNIPANQIRGMGVQVSKLDGDPAAAAVKGTGRQGFFKSAPAGKRSEWTDTAVKARYSGWYDMTAAAGPKPTGGVEGGGSAISFGGHNYSAALSERPDSGTLMAALTRGGLVAPFSPNSHKVRRVSLEQTSPAFAAVTELARAEADTQAAGDEARRMDEFNGVSEATAGAEAETEEEEEEEEEDEKGTSAVDEAEAALTLTYEAAARMFAWERQRGRGDELSTDPALLLSDAEAILLEVSRGRLASEGFEGAAAAVDSARSLALAQECLPPLALVLTSGALTSGAMGGSEGGRKQSDGGSIMAEFASCWRSACDRVEDELVTTFVHSQ